MKSNRKFSNIIIIAVIMMMCAATSVALLFGRMVRYSQTEFENIIPLIGTNSELPNAGADATAAAQTAYSGTGNLSNISSGAEGMQAHPEYHMVAEAEIFKLSYDETGKTTVIGAEGNTDKLIAPGTSNQYHFTLENSGDVALDYTMSMEAYITGTDEIIPVKARVWDYTNKYLLGSEEEMNDVLKLNTVSEEGVLGAGRYAAYTLEWEWPFEQGNDEFDTMLGNMAVDDDLVLTIKINTTAEYDEDPANQNVGQRVPQTGDDSSLEFLWLILAASIIGIFIVLLADRKSKKETDGKTHE